MEALMESTCSIIQAPRASHQALARERAPKNQGGERQRMQHRADGTNPHETVHHHVLGSEDYADGIIPRGQNRSYTSGEVLQKHTSTLTPTSAKRKTHKSKGSSVLDHPKHQVYPSLSNCQI